MQKKTKYDIINKEVNNEDTVNNISNITTSLYSNDMQTDLKWEDVKVGDIITVELPYAPYLMGNQTQLTGEVVSIRRIELDPIDPLADPLAIRYPMDDYIIRIKTDEKYEFPFNMEDRNKEYVIQSHIWKLINIERKNMETQEQQLKLGDTVLVTSKDVKRSLGFPMGEELVAEIVVYNSEGHILIQSNQLVELRLGHNGERPQQFPKGGCWWVSEKDLQLTEKQPEFDIFM